ncbi:AbrB family transcriptional regulator [Fructilactobacillus cliffordii]|nr:AbrB family transcriptional regulator [Fructilactobacillus cliffordii]USS86316.1 AbrB family transcriptional regulator [Fructilactobacillus cliffordii]
MEQKFPSADDWKQVLSQIPIETVEFDENGNYDDEKHPEFHDWMKNYN